MSKYIEHLDISFVSRDWQRENPYNEITGARVETLAGYPFVFVSVGDRWDDESASVFMSATEATQLKDALVEALARISRMRPKENK